MGVSAEQLAGGGNGGEMKDGMRAQAVTFQFKEQNVTSDKAHKILST